MQFGRCTSIGGSGHDLHPELRLIHLHLGDLEINPAQVGRVGKMCILRHSSPLLSEDDVFNAFRRPPHSKCSCTHPTVGLYLGSQSPPAYLCTRAVLPIPAAETLFRAFVELSVDETEGGKGASGGTGIAHDEQLQRNVGCVALLVATAPLGALKDEKHNQR